VELPEAYVLFTSNGEVPNILNSTLRNHGRLKYFFNKGVSIYHDIEVYKEKYIKHMMANKVLQI